MKKFLSLICLMTFLTTTTSVWASVKVPANTNIPINVAKKETSKTVSSGTTIEAKIAEDVFIDDEVIFEKGDRAVLNVISVKRRSLLAFPEK